VSDVLYRSSGKIPIVGLLVGAIAAPVVAIPSAPIYAYATVYCPVAQLSVLLTLVFGGVLGAVPALAMVRLGKVRNMYVVALFALGTAALGYLLSWPVWLYATMNRNSPIPFEIFLDPLRCTQMLASVYELGSWTIGRSGEPVSGLFLGAFWLVEAGLIFGTAGVAGAGIGAAESPFCERCEAWCQRVGPLAHYPVEHEAHLVPRLAAGDVAVLGEVPQGDPGFRPIVQVQGFRCPSCRNMATMLVQRVSMTRDGRGNPIEHRFDLVRHLLVRGSDIDWAQGGAQGRRPPG
jgi:hypothetical protein